MALIIETGGIVADADSYVTVVEVLAYATKRGLALSSTDATFVESLVIKAMDFFEALEGRFQGSRVSADQVLSWPRQDVSVHGYEVATDAIPPVLKRALCQLALDADVYDLMPSSDGREILEEKVDVITTKYAQTNSAAPQPSLTAFFNIAAPLLSSGGAFTLDLERI